MAQQTTQRPIWEKRAKGGLSIAVWSRDEADQHGNTITRHSITLKKRYKDKDGNWQDSGTWFPEDLPKVARLVEHAYDFILLSNGGGESQQE